MSSHKEKTSTKNDKKHESHFDKKVEKKTEKPKTSKLGGRQPRIRLNS
jgi:hypothetical protein